MDSTAAAPAIADRAGFAAFAARVLADAGLQAQLGAIVDDDAFSAACMRIAADAGIALTQAELSHGLVRQPLDMSRWLPPPIALDTWPERGWLPARTVPGAPPAFDWAWFGPDPLRDPFFRSSADRACGRPLSRLFRTRTSIEALVSGAREAEAVPPTGFVFHLSRCGSTLVARMLAAVDHHIVASEPEPLDAVLVWLAQSGLAQDVQVRVLRAIVGALGRNRSGSARRFFIKFDSWHAAQLPLIRAAFPEVPWIFLYRDPVEVLVSQMRARGLQTVPGALPPHMLDIPDGEALPPERYVAAVLARICQAVLDYWHVGGGMLVDYAELPGAMAERIPAHFGFTLDAAEYQAMHAASADNAKAPGEPFDADSERKQAAASAAIRAEAGLVAPLYARLEALRLAQDEQDCAEHCAAAAMSAQGGN